MKTFIYFMLSTLDIIFNNIVTFYKHNFGH